MTIDNRPRLAKQATWLIALVCLSFSNPASAQQNPLSLGDLAVYRGAFEAAELNALPAARALSTQASNPVLVDVITWLDLQRRGGDASLSEITQFLDGHTGWPGLTDIRLQAERIMPENWSAAERVAWHQRYPPLTFDALMAYADALSASGRGNEAALYLRTRWTDIPITSAQQDRMVARFGGSLSQDDHWRRLDNLIWSGRLNEARQMLPLVDSGRRALANARILLQARQSGVDAAIQAVPASLQNDEGLAYERTRWRRRAGLDAGAIELLSVQPVGSDYGRRWWTERHYQAREAFNRRDYQTAYRLASDHRQTGGFPRLQGEWLSGWVALRFLNDPGRAFGHFQTLYESTNTPISRSRGAYWAGRSQAALGNQAEAQRWYQIAAQHPTAF
ncbi:MAG: lytic transglycosylase domain-containing protein, partial [Pseudomonadota bacterium]